MKQSSNVSRKLDVVNEGNQQKYDANIKFLLSEKIILAHILVHTIAEFKGMDVKEVVPLIEGTPLVAQEYVDAGESNTFNESNKTLCADVPPTISGLNTEDIVPNEGKVTYDIRFVVWTPDKKEQIKLLIDVEAQNNSRPGYDLVTRGVYNTSRMISAQKNVEFTNSHYENIKKVYSIWICTDVPIRDRNTIVHFALTPEDIVGYYQANKRYYDIPHVILIGLSREIVEASDEHILLRMLETILSPTLEKPVKKQILEEEYNIPMTEEFDRRTDVMCDLSQAILDEGIEKGIEKGEERLATLINRLTQDGRASDIQKVVSDANFRKELYIEYNI